MSRTVKDMVSEIEQKNKAKDDVNVNLKLNKALSLTKLSSQILRDWITLSNKNGITVDKTENNKSRKSDEELTETLENISAVDYSEAAKRYEEVLARYLFKHKLAHKGVDDILAFYLKKYPLDKNPAAYGQISSVESGAVGRDIKEMQEIINGGNLREKVSMLCNFSSFAMEHHSKKGVYLVDSTGKNTVLEDMFTKSNSYTEKSGLDFDRGNRVLKTDTVNPSAENGDQRFKVIDGKEHILEEISQGLRTSREVRYFFSQNPNFAKEIGGQQKIDEHIKTLQKIEKFDIEIRNEENEEKKEELKKSRKKLKESVKELDQKIRERLRPGSAWWDFSSKNLRKDNQESNISPTVADFNSRGVNLVAGISAHTRSIFVVANELSVPKDILLNLRLAILADFIMERHHTFHEIMQVTSKMFGMPYDDSDIRYRHIEPLTENELREAITKNKKYYAQHPDWEGKFPDEIGKSLQESSKIKK